MRNHKVRKSDRVISFDSPKEAALYFDQVVPVDFALPFLASSIRQVGVDGADEFVDRIVKSEVPAEPDDLRRVLQSLSRGDRRQIDAYYKLQGVNLCPWLGFLSVRISDPESEQSVLSQARETFAEAGIDFDDFCGWMKSKDNLGAAEFFNRYTNVYEGILSGAGFGDAPTWFPNASPSQLASESAREEDFLVLLRGVDMIDANQLTWEQIIALRDDPDHMSSLRDLRLYFEDNFQGQDPSLVRDRLEQAIENQRLTAKYWKLDLAKKTLGIAATKGNVALTSMATLAPVLAGAPLPIAAAAGALITTATCALEFRQVRVDQQKARLTRPLRFLTKLEDVKTG